MTLALTAPPEMTEFDAHLWGAGGHYRTYRKLGAHLCEKDGQPGVFFAVWAPNGSAVSVMGDFNMWSRDLHPLEFEPTTGVWSGFIPNLKVGSSYKYCVRSHGGRTRSEHCDPYGYWSELRPSNASRVYDLTQYEWKDAAWIKHRQETNIRQLPMSIYEVHLGSWMRKLDNTWMTYRELADKLVDYVEQLGSTHVELMPITEHPFDGSWGYQTTGYFAATSRFGEPDDLRYLIDTFHQRNIGVILDWVPAHFPKDGHGLAYFDGTHLFEHQDPRQGYHPDWGTLIFNYGRNEVRNFLISSALFWIDEFHIDGLRVDAVATMLYLDFSRKDGEWVANKYGGRENLEAIAFLQEMNAALRKEYPDVFTVAEESTTFEGVTRSEADGGLGFTFKWNMGWMNDSLEYIKFDPIYRKFHHNKMTFGMTYQYTEDFVLPYSHDEVVHLKKSMLSKMPGDEWQMRANLRCLYAYMFGYPGKKLIFMGSEFGQWNEWTETRALDWEVLGEATHRGLLNLSQAIHHIYKSKPALYELDNHPDGFKWLDCDDADNSFLAFVRNAHSTLESLLFICNFTPVPRRLRMQLPWEGEFKLLLNSDDLDFNGSGLLPFAAGETLKAEQVSHRGQLWSAELTLPPLSTIIMTGQRPFPKEVAVSLPLPETVTLFYDHKRDEIEQEEEAA